MTAPDVILSSLGKHDVVIACPASPDHPCQDACATLQGFVHGTPFLVLAVADGHGAQRYKNSAVGSKIAVDCAIHCLSETARTIIEDGFRTPEEQIVDTSFLKRHTERTLPANLLRRWNESVNAEIEDVRIRADTDPDDITSYGTTLVAALVVENHVIVVSIGDSAAFHVRPADNATVFDEVCKDTVVRASNKTDSMCSSDARYKWRGEYIQRSSGNYMLVLTSDGMIDSLEHDQLSLALVSLYQGFDELGHAWAAEQLPYKLREWTNEGSRDDMATAVLFHRGSKT